MQLFNFNPGRIEPSVISAKTMWRLAGAFALFLPLALFLGNLFPGGCKTVQDSISAYYYTPMRNLFEGVLCSVAFFLFAYNGYEPIDAVTSKIASFFALGIAFCPTTYKNDIPPCFIPPINTNAFIGAMHYVSAAVFFLTISFMSLFLFTRTHDGKTERDATGGKRARNAVYRVCGILMLVFLALIPIYNFIVRKYVEIPSLTFYLESAILVCFGVSWLVKGRTLRAVAVMMGLGGRRSP
jgi:hypothetical protein